MPDDITQPDVDLGQAQTPDVGQAPTATPQLANQQPSGPRPILLDLIQGLVHPRMQASGPGQMAQPVSRAQTFENFLGNFVYALGQGFANAGHGPGSFGRGFGAAATAPMELQAAQQQRASQLAQQQAQTAQTQAQTAAMPAELQAKLQAMTQQPRFDPETQQFIGQMNDAQYQQYVRGLAAAKQSRQGKESATAASKDIAQKKLDAASATQQSKLDQFRQTLDYKKWKENLDTQTRLKTAAMTSQAAQNKAPAQLMQTATFAQGGLQMLDDAQAAFQDLKNRGVLGSVTSDKVEDWLFGKGLIDPSLSPQDRKQIGKMRAAMGYTSSATMRTHTGRSSQEMYHDFKDKMGLSQGSDALEGTFDETRTLLGHYANAASDSSIQALRSGTSGVPAKGSTLRFRAGGKIYNIPSERQAEFLKDFPSATRIGQ